MTTRETDPLLGAIAYLDGAIELCPHVRREARVSALTHPIRLAAEAGELMALVWLILVMLPGVGLALVTKAPLVVALLITATAMLIGWTLYAWHFSDQVGLGQGQYRDLVHAELDQVERFFFEARSGRYGAEIAWEGQNPRTANPKVMLRTLRNTRAKLAWLTGTQG